MTDRMDRLKTQYVTGSDSYRTLSEKSGVPLRTLSERGRKERWPEERKKYRKKVLQKTENRQADRDAGKLGALMDAADLLSQEIRGIVTDEQQFFRRYTQNVNRGEDGVLQATALEFVTQKADTKALTDMVRALSELTRVMRDLYGLRNDYSVPQGEWGVIEMPEVKHSL